VPSLTPKQAAETSGFSLDTVRYYERIGLLPQIRRTAAGRRVFSEIDLMWLGLLRCLRDTGMPIAEMQEFVRLMNGGAGTATERAEVLTAHHRRVEDQIIRLQHHLELIRGKIEMYRDGEPWSPHRVDDAAGSAGAPGPATAYADSPHAASAAVRQARPVRTSSA
jgi:DNA-binding transcriptional MerR regulator